jgi:hypothetical protein
LPAVPGKGTPRHDQHPGEVGRRCPYDNTKPLIRAGHWLFAWEADPTWGQAKADEWGVAVSDLLCVGCETLRQRLIAEGTWPA